jgi:Tol biopolymer transport system component
VKPDGSNKINLTNSLDQDIKPVWSADSKWIAFTSNKRESDTDPNWDIYVVHYDGSYLKKITTNIGTDSDPIWLPYRSNP